MMSARAIKRFKPYHVLAWMAVFGLWYFFRHQDYASNSLAFNITVLKVADLALMVYVTNYLLIPCLLYKKQYFVFSILFVALVFTTSWLKLHIEGILMHSPGTYDLVGNFKSNVYDNTIPHFLLVSTAAAFKLVFDYAKAQRKLGEMAKEKAEAELNFLKSQINPHFVFNSLNSVYFLIDKQNNEARDALHKFSEMLRYQLYECNGDKTSIEKEIVYLRDYIGMQRLRRDDNCVINFDIDENVKGFAIEPLLLIPFIENSFKHLSHYSGQPNSVDINFYKKEHVFTMKVTNSTEPKSNTACLQQAGGIGLKNVKRRLELLYPHKHFLEITNDHDVFTVILQIDV